MACEKLCILSFARNHSEILLNPESSSLVFWNKFLMLLSEQNMFVSSVICLYANLTIKYDKNQRT